MEHTETRGQSSAERHEADWPTLITGNWQDTRRTLHLYAQIVGKIRLKLHPRINHWWHSTLAVSAVGWTTGLIPLQNRAFEIEFNFLRHQLWIRDSEGQARHFPLKLSSISEFHERLFGALGEIDIHPKILETPYDAAKVKSSTPFYADRAPESYDRTFALHLWHAQLETDQVFKEFRGRFTGKASPVQLFWHSFDLALTFFSGRPAPDVPGMGRIDRDAYSKEVISFGFWPGDDETPEPAYYSYTYPEPPNLAREPLKPLSAYWMSRPRGTLAILKYSDVKRAEDPKAILHEFLESAFLAGSRTANWDAPELQLLPPEVAASEFDRPWL